MDSILGVSGPISVESTLDRFDRSFAAGDLDGIVSLFSDDAVLLVHRQPSIAGRAAVRDAFGEVFAAFDTSDYESRYDTIEVHVDSAYVMGDIVEGLRPQDGGSGIRVYVRVVLFFRRIDLSWVITRLLTGRFAPDEPLP